MMKEDNLKVVNVDIDALMPADYNPRVLTEKQYSDIKDSLIEFGFIDPVIVNQNAERNNIIVGGHQRVRVAKSLGMDAVPCVFVDLPLDKERELNVRLNKNTGEWDWDVLANEFDIEDLVSWGFEEHEFGIEDGIEMPDHNDCDFPEFSKMTFQLSEEQWRVVSGVIKELKSSDEFKYVETFGNENSNGNALYLMASKCLK